MGTAADEIEVEARAFEAARTERPDRAWRWWFGGAMTLVLLAGLANLPLPFAGDEALFTLGSRELSKGAVLYRDFWDFKQPGIYGFYLAGNKLFGFTEVGIHAWELLWWLAFSVFLAFTLRGRMRHQTLAALAPVAVALYLAAARANDLGQIEELLAIPLYVALWAVDDSTGPVSKRRWFLSGVAGAVVLLMKHLFFVIPLAFWLRALVRQRTRGGVGALALGVLVPLAPVVAYFTAVGQWGTIWWTYFVYTPATTSADARPASRLVDGFGHVGTTYAPFLLLAAVAVYFHLRARRRPFVTELSLWLLLAVPIVMLGLWWPYHFLIFVMPILVLAMIGLDELADRLSAKQLVAVGVVAALLMLPFARDAARKGRELASNHFGLTTEGRRALRESIESDYRHGPGLVAFLHEPSARPGDIYVIANPLFQLMSGRDQAISYNGWNADVSTTELFDKTSTELARARPPYIFIDHGARTIIGERSSRLDEFLRDNYRELSRHELGVWYELNT